MSTLISILRRFINSDMTKPLNTMIDEVKSTLALIKTKTDLITSNLFTSTHASRIDATISSRQADAGLTSTHVGRLDDAISTRADKATVDAIKAKTDTFISGGVKSVQRGEATIGTTTYIVTVTINAVNIAKTVVNNLGYYGSSSGLIRFGEDGTSVGCGMFLVDSKSLKIKLSTPPDKDVIVSWEVIEYY